MTSFLRWFLLAGLVVPADVRSIAAAEMTGPGSAPVQGRGGGFYPRQPRPPVEISQPVTFAVEANRGFAVDLYRQLARENQGKNLFFSPYSMSAALAMTAEGARGETALQMGEVLHFPKESRRSGKDAEWIPWNHATIDAGLADLDKQYNAENDCELRVANALWGEKTYPFAKAYLDAIEKSYGTGHVTPVDFVHNAEAARELINTWVEDQTKDRIKNLIPPRYVDRDTALVLTNAIYFKGQWVEAFQANGTKDEDFFLEDGTKVRAPLMHHDVTGSASYAAFNGDGTVFNIPFTMAERSIQGGGAGGTKAPARYPDQDGFTMLELAYKGEKLSLIVLLPQAADGLPALEKMLTAANLKTWIGTLRRRRVDVFLPKFKLETSYEMKKPLIAMGMPRAFDYKSAQFSGMNANGRDELFISKVLHKAFVDVNEKGTEAAAATAVIMAKRAMVIAKPFTPIFRADKPFVFLIYDKHNGNVLFLGRMMKP
jgi:serine protease inhibitor